MSTPPEPDAPPLTTVYVTNATQTSAGPGPGPKALPAGEAAWLLKSRLAIAGDRAPRGFGGDALDDGLRH